MLFSPWRHSVMRYLLDASIASSSTVGEAASNLELGTFSGNTRSRLRIRRPSRPSRRGQWQDVVPESVYVFPASGRNFQS